MQRKTWITVLAVVVVAGGISLWWNDSQQRVLTVEPAQDLDSASTGAMTGDEIENLDSKVLAEDQLAANQAAARELGEPPITAPLTERPPFVSLIEWNVLKRVASQHPEPGRELVRLVNHLRFAKQWELWTESDSVSEVQREALGRQLLEEIPQRVTNRELDAVYAQQMQMTLLNNLISDPQERRRRAAEEAARIGINFSVEKS